MDLTHATLFSGIGGPELAAESLGWENVFHCEINEFGQRILSYYWPQSIAYENIKETDFTIHRGSIDVLTGGFPCQPYSTAGKRKGKDDDRHLWPEMLRAIKEIQPRWIVGENVRGLVSWNGGLVFDEVQADLEAESYEVLPFLFPACAVNAPHRRDRIWFIAYAPSYGYDAKETPRNNTIGKNYKQQRSQRICTSKRFSNERFAAYTCGNGYKQRRFRKNRFTQRTRKSQRIQRQWIRENAFRTSYKRVITNTCKFKLQRCKYQRSIKESRKIKTQSRQLSRSICGRWEEFPTQSPVCNGNDGFSTRLDGKAIQSLLKGKKPRQPWIPFAKWRNESIKAGGNAIVPQAILQIYKAIENYEKLSE